MSIKNLKLRYKIAAAATTGAMVIGGGSAAFAYFTSTGNGTGTGSVGTASNWVVTTSTATATGYASGLQPGIAASDETVTVSIKNNGAGQQQLNKFVISVLGNDGTTAWTNTAFQPDGKTPVYAGESACSLSDFALGSNTTSGSFTVSPGVEIAPGVTNTYKVNLHMIDNTSAAQDNCQGASPALYVAAS